MTNRVCLSVPGEVLEIVDAGAHRPPTAHVDIAGVRRQVDTTLLADGELRPGDWVLVHLGFVLGKIDESEARETRRMLEGLDGSHG